LEVEELNRVLTRFGSALTRLEEAIALNPTEPLSVEGTIQRFEFTIELAWKSLKLFLADAGISADSPKEALRQGFRARWIEDEMIWLEMLEDRNQTTHIYQEAKAREIFEHLSGYSQLLRKLHYTLTERIDSAN